MQSIQFNSQPFHGINLQPHGTWRPGVCAVAENVVLDGTGSLSRRPAVQKIATVHADSRGIFDHRGAVTAIVPNTVTDPAPALTEYASVDTAVLDSVESVQIDGEGKLFILATSNGSPAFYYDGAQAPSPFTPGGDILSAEGRLWAVDPGQGLLRYSALEDWVNWQEPNSNVDNGLDVSRYAEGSSRLNALGNLAGKLALFFDDAIQVWRPHPDPAAIFLEVALKGPGCYHPMSIVSMRRDVMYYGRGGFRLLSGTLRDGETDAGNIGDPIDPLVANILATESIAAHWSDARQQFYCARGSTVYCLSLEIGGRNGWTTWELPVSVDMWCEAGGQVYFRSGDDIYRLDDEAETDEAGGAIPVTIQLETMRHPAGQLIKATHVSAQATEALTLGIASDGVDRDDRVLGTEAGKPARSRVFGRAYGWDLTIHDPNASSDWRLDALSFIGEV